MARARGIKKPHPLGSVASRSGVPQLTAASGFPAAGGVKISELPVADVANDIDQLEVNQGGVSRRVTVEQLAAAVALLDITSTPEDFGAVGDGVTVDDDAITAWLAYCTANNQKAVTTPGKTYLLSDFFVAFIRVPFDGTGSEFHCSNNGQAHNSVFIIESMPDDIEEVLKATADTWTGLYRGSRKIAQLVGQSGWCYAFYTPNNQVFLERSSTDAGQQKGEAFEVVSDDGILSKVIPTDYTVPFVNVVGPPASVFFGQRRRVRPRMVVEGLTIRLMTELPVKNVTAITKAAAGVVTCVGHGFPNGCAVRFSGVGGMTELNATTHEITVTGVDTFTIGNTSTYGTYTSGGTVKTAARDRMVDIHRPHTTLRDCFLINETDKDCAQGYVHSYTSNIVYEGCVVENLAPQKADAVNRLTTCYGFNGAYADDITFRDCSARNCRRGVDAGGCSNYAVDGGNFPDGIGGHWLNGLYVYGRPYISSQHPTNPHCILMSGSDLNVESAQIQLPLECNVATMRGDLPELRGLMRLGPGVEIMIDETGDPAGASTQRNVLNFPKGGALFDTLRPVYLPERIELSAVIRAVGASADNRIALVYIEGATGDATPAGPGMTVGFPQPIMAPLEVDIAPSVVSHPGSMLVGAVPRYMVIMAKCATQTSTSGPTKVRIRGMRCVEVNMQPSVGTDPATDGRWDLHVSDIQDTSVFYVAYGAVRNSLLSRVNTASTVTSAIGLHALPIGDEQRRWDATVEAGSYTPTLTGVANITSVTPLLCYYTVIREGPQTMVEVHGQISCTPTAAAATPTSLGISLPVTTTFSAAGQLSGMATVVNATLSAGITADTVNGRASMAWNSTTATPTANHFSARFRYRVA